MRSDLDFQCRCGAVKGVCHEAGGSMGIRVVCYCSDCRAFAFFLKREDDLLDRAGGTDIYQTSPSRLEITEGMERIAGVVVAPNGMHRYYAACCRTPLANTIRSAPLPFAGTFVANYNAAQREAALGPPAAAVFVKDALSEPAGTKGTPLPLLILGLMRRASAEWIAGSWKRNLFREAADAGVLGPPHLLSAEERSQLDARAKAWSRPVTDGVAAQ